MELQKLPKTLHLRKVKNQTRSTISFPTIARKVRVTGSILPNLILVSIKGLKVKQHARFASRKRNTKLEPSDGVVGVPVG